MNIAEVIEVTATAVNAVAYSALALMGLMLTARMRVRAVGWFSAMFVALATVSVLTLVMPVSAGSVVANIQLAALSLVPLFIYRFTRAFTRGSAAIDIGSVLATAVIFSWTIAIDFPLDQSDWGTSTKVYFACFVGHWVLLTGGCAFYFLREAQASNGISARRMRLFAWAILLLAGVILLVAAIGDQGTDRSLVVKAIMELAGGVAGVLFWFALIPPRALRASWRTREFESMQGGLREMIGGESIDEVRARTLDVALKLTGGSGALVLDEHGAVLATRDLTLDEAQAMIEEAQPHADRGQRRRCRLIVADRLIVACGSAMPFFSSEERTLLDMVSAFSGLAEHRAKTLDIERDTSERYRQLDLLKTEFVAMVAHDMRSPMAVISGFADTIHDRWNEISDEDKLQYLQLISRNTRSLAAFVEDVLQVARMESGELSYAVEPFDARVVAQRIVTDMRIAFPHLTLTIDAPDELPHALGDADRNWQILNNLVGNAIKFSGDEPTICVDIQLRADSQAVAIAVRDNGVGIATDDIPRLFRRFSRVGESRATVAGSGLGLYIVKSMVEAQGGEIWVQSVPGQGSTFTYTMPLAPVEAIGEPVEAGVLA